MWFEVTECDHAIWRIDECYVDISERGMCYFVKGRDFDLLIDGGYGLVPMRANLPLVDGERTRFVATHTHFDHIGAAWEFAERWAHPEEAEVMAAPTRENTGIHPYVMGLDTAELFDPVPPDWVSAETYSIRPAPVTKLLNDGDIIDMGDRQFEVLHTPGHSPGSISLWEAATGVLISADVLYDGHLLDELEGSNIPDLLRSHERLEKLPITVVHPGHYGSFDGDRARELIAAYRELRADWV